MKYLRLPGFFACFHHVETPCVSPCFTTPCLVVKNQAARSQVRPWMPTKLPVHSKAEFLTWKAHGKTGYSLCIWQYFSTSFNNFNCDIPNKYPYNINIHFHHYISLSFRKTTADDYRIDQNGPWGYMGISHGSYNVVWLTRSQIPNSDGLSIYKWGEFQTMIYYGCKRHLQSLDDPPNMLVNGLSAQCEPYAVW